jgi:molybdenum cofactor cytidylyltransferase
MQLAPALRLTPTSSVAFVGAGGKTSALFRAARELAPAVLTTTTHLGDWQVAEADRHFVWPENTPLPALESALGGGLTLVTGPLDAASQRYHGLTIPQIHQLHEVCGYHALPLLIEADGARQKPLKAPAAHEPVIPEWVETVVVVAGLSGLNQALTEATVHRAERFAALSGLEMGETIRVEALARVLSHLEGGLKGLPTEARRVLLLNQADTLQLQAQAGTLGEALLSTYSGAVIATLRETEKPVLAVKEPIAGIILAAGKASRYGQPKQLLDFHGQPFVRAVAETALKAGLWPVVVVTGAKAESVGAAVADLPVKIVHNAEWESGQGSSIRVGVLECGSSASAGVEVELPHSRKPGGAVFLLADQPQVSVEIVRELVERHSLDLPAVLAPYVFDQRANPVLFDQVTFPDLLQLTGDQGGRAIFGKFSPRYLNWYDKSLLLDVDTPADYQRLVGGEE